jgi:hypothetical protein
MVNKSTRTVSFETATSAVTKTIVTGLILFCGLQSAARADVDTYVFSSNASTNLDGTATENITGGFTFDTTTGAVTALTITLANGDAPFDGTYSNSLDTCTTTCTSVFGTNGGSTLFVFFAQDLGASPDALKSTEWSSASVSPFLGLDSSPTGSVVFTTTAAVPEPSPITLLVTMVAMVGFLTRRKLAGGYLRDR